MSVYTSFFTYYKHLTGDLRVALGKDKAEAAHYELVERVFMPLESDLEQLQAALDNKMLESRKEEGEGIWTGQVGKGPRYQALMQEAFALEKQKNELTATINRLRPKFEYDTSDLSPEEILKNDREALASVPADLVDQEVQLSRESYIDVEQDILLTAPYYKVVRQEPEALIALGLAIGMDGSILLLGAAVSTRERKSVIKKLSDFLSSSIKESKVAAKTLCEAISEPVDVHPTQADLDELHPTVENIKKKVPLNMFFGYLLMKIDPETLKIDIDLKSIPQPVAYSYRLFFERLRNPKINWVDFSRDQGWYIKQDCYSRFISWLTTEIEKDETPIKKFDEHHDFFLDSSSNVESLPSIED